MNLFFSLSIILMNLSFNFTTPENKQYIALNDEDDFIHYGPTEIMNQSIENLTIDGPANIQNSRIAKLATIIGSVEAKNATFDTVKIDGRAYFNNVTVTKILVISSPITALDSTIEEILITSNELFLINTRVRKIFVRKNDQSDNPQRVYLRKGSRVDTILFEAKNGLVIFGDASIIVQTIEGGSIEDENRAH